MYLGLIKANASFFDYGLNLRHCNYIYIGERERGGERERERGREREREREEKEVGRHR